MADPHEYDQQGVIVRKNVNADNQAGDPEEATPVTGRPADKPPANSTLAERAKAAGRGKAVKGGDAENKAMDSAETETKARPRVKRA